MAPSSYNILTGPEGVIQRLTPLLQAPDGGSRVQRSGWPVDLPPNPRCRLRHHVGAVVKLFQLSSVETFLDQPRAHRLQVQVVSLAVAAPWSHVVKRRDVHEVQEAVTEPIQQEAVRAGARVDRARERVAAAEKSCQEQLLATAGGRCNGFTQNQRPGKSDRIEYAPRRCVFIHFPSFTFLHSLSFSHFPSFTFLQSLSFIHFAAAAGPESAAPQMLGGDSLARQQADGSLVDIVLPPGWFSSVATEGTAVCRAANDRLRKIVALYVGNLWRAGSLPWVGEMSVTDICTWVRESGLGTDFTSLAARVVLRSPKPEVVVDTKVWSTSLSHPLSPASTLKCTDLARAGVVARHPERKRQLHVWSSNDQQHRGLCGRA